MKVGVEGDIRENLLPHYESGGGGRYYGKPNEVEENIQPVFRNIPPTRENGGSY